MRDDGLQLGTRDKVVQKMTREGAVEKISVNIPREESAKEHQTLTFLMSGKMSSWLVRDWILAVTDFLTGQSALKMWILTADGISRRRG